MAHEPQDLINGGFKLGAGIMQSTNVAAIRRDRKVKGMNVWSVVFFNAWGVWSSYYYAGYLWQPLSWLGNLAIISANLAWVWMAFRVRPLRSYNYFITKDGVRNLRNLHIFGPEATNARKPKSSWWDAFLQLFR